MAIRVLHILGGLNPGGIEVWLMQVLRSFPRSEIEIDFALQQDSPGVFDDEARSLKANLFRIGSWRNLRVFKDRLQSLIRDRNYTVLHSHGYLNSGVVNKIGALAKVPVRISHSHNCIRKTSIRRPLRRIYESIMRRNINRYSTHKIAISNDAARSLFGNSWSKDPRTRILYYGFDFSKFQFSNFDRQEVRKELKIDLYDRVLVNVGSFYPQKNHSFLLEVAHMLIASNQAYKIVLVGDGPLRDSIEKRVVELGLQRYFRFAGIRSDVHRVLSASDVFVFPSLFEGLGIAALEAQAAGIPCVVNSCLPMELTVSESLVTRLPIGNTVSDWASCITKTKLDRMPTDITIAMLNGSRFGLTQCLDQLSAIYSEQK